MFQPKYQISPRITKALVEIEASRNAVDSLPITTDVLISLRESAKLAATHYSTYIEGNRLTQAQVDEVIVGHDHFPGRKRDEQEVRHYYAALSEVELLARMEKLLTEKQVQTLHAIVETGRHKKSRYRDGQNVIKDSATRAIVYLPPEAKDVPQLMSELIEWINQSINKNELPIPIIAALAHYQFVTIHPYYDGNGRTGRLLTTLILHMNGYGLRGIYALEEYYAINLGAYYSALSTSDHHNYYMGRADADVTEFIDYFCQGMAIAFKKVEEKAQEAFALGQQDQSPLLRKLDSRQRQVLALFRRHYIVTTDDIAAFFSIKSRSAHYLCRQWVESGFLKIANPSKRKREYALTSKYEKLIS